MGFQCGIVGLPNVGKSTIFNALTAARAEAANFPFCTIEPNTGVVPVPDPRLERIAERIPTRKVVPASMTFVDIAGLVKGASRGEGLGNRFLGHVREMQAIAHVVRCFADENVAHVDGSVDPLRDIRVIDTELALADLETVDRRLEGVAKRARAGGEKEAQAELPVLERARAALDEGCPVRSMGLDEANLRRLDPLHLITAKKVMYIANVDEAALADLESHPHYQRLVEHAAQEGAPVVPICGKIEAEIAQLDPEEKREFLDDLGLEEPGLNHVIRTGYELLGLRTFFTVGPKELRAWTIRAGSTAREAAGAVHSDFERGFIRAEVYHFDDLVRYGSEAAIREAGALRIEGKSYVVQDGDILHVRFSV